MPWELLAVRLCKLTKKQPKPNGAPRIVGNAKHALFELHLAAATTQRTPSSAMAHEMQNAGNEYPSGDGG